MSIQITGEMEQLIHAICLGGNYANEMEVMGEALKLLSRREQLRGEIQAGIAELDAGQRIAGNEAFDRLEERARRIQNLAQGDT
ncbi:MAG TPA: hypothetical protein VGI75_07180 [Pirellulales bacterium]|jgi:antitoxin ParD1/3/4